MKNAEYKIEMPFSAVMVWAYHSGFGARFFERFGGEVFDDYNHALENFLFVNQDIKEFLLIKGLLKETKPKNIIKMKDMEPCQFGVIEETEVLAGTVVMRSTKVSDTEIIDLNNFRKDGWWGCYCESTVRILDTNDPTDCELIMACFRNMLPGLGGEK